MDLGRVMGASRWGTVGALVVVMGGLYLDRPLLAWGGVAAVAVALAADTAAKFAVYGRLSVPRGDRLKVMAAWLAVALTVLALVVDYVHARLAPGYDGFFWSLVVAAGGFSAVYAALRHEYVPAEEKTD